MMADQIKYVEAFNFFTNEFEEKEKRKIEASEQRILILNILKSLSYMNVSFGNQKEFFPSSELFENVEIFKAVINIAAQKFSFDMQGESYNYKSQTINTAILLFELFQNLSELAKEKENFSDIRKVVKDLADGWTLFYNQMQTDRRDARNHLKSQKTRVASLWQNRNDTK